MECHILVQLALLIGAVFEVKDRLLVVMFLEVEENSSALYVTDDDILVGEAK
jgi:hypothetical protein